MTREEQEAIVANAVLKHAATSARLLCEIATCWNEAVDETRTLPPKEREFQLAVRFTEKFAGRALVPADKLFQRIDNEHRAQKLRSMLDVPVTAG